AEAIAQLHDSPQQDRADTQLPPHLLRIRLMAFVAEDSAPRHHTQSGELRQVVDDAFGDPVREIFSFRVGAGVDEGQHRQRVDRPSLCAYGLFDYYFGLSAGTVRKLYVFDFHLLHVGGEAVAAAGDGLDVLILGKSTTQGEDVAREVVLFDYHIRPDLPHQLFLVDDVPASADKCQESFIDLRFELQRRAFTQQDALAGVEAEGAELVKVLVWLFHLQVKNWL